MADTVIDNKLARFTQHRRKSTYRLLTFALALVYGAILSQIPSEEFKDFGNYLVYTEQSWARLLRLLNQSPIVALSNEPLWLLINAVLGNFLSPEATVRLIIFISAAIVAWLVLLSDPRQFVWLLAVLLLPMVVKNHIIHLRQGVAIAVFLFGWFSNHRVARWLLMGSAAFIHASFFFVLLIYIVAKIMIQARLDASCRTVGFVTMGLIAAGGMGWLGALLGARQAQAYHFTMADVSGLGFLIWISILVLLILEGRRFLSEHAFETGMIIFYLSTYWFIEVTARIFESGIVPVLLAGLALTKWRRSALLAVMLFVLGGFSWLMRIGQSAMGFGIT